ncbi:hypothetical protein HC256_000440 [Beauveria bassiana]|nr:hypothetical protein HC256_000440 [Beauveria bassiana]
MSLKLFQTRLVSQRGIARRWFGEDPILDVVFAVNRDNGALRHELSHKGSRRLALVLDAVVDFGVLGAGAQAQRLLARPDAIQALNILRLVEQRAAATVGHGRTGHRDAAGDGGSCGVGCLCRALAVVGVEVGAALGGLDTGNFAPDEGVGALERIAAAGRAAVAGAAAAAAEDLGASVDEAVGRVASASRVAAVVVVRLCIGGATQLAQLVAARDTAAAAAAGRVRTVDIAGAAAAAALRVAALCALQVVRMEVGGGAEAGLFDGGGLVGGPLADCLAAVDLVLADAAVLLDLGPAKHPDMRLKLDLVPVDPERAGARGKVAVDVAAVARLADHLDPEHVVLAQDAVDGVAVLWELLAGELPVAEHDSRRARAVQGVEREWLRTAGGILVRRDGDKGVAGSSSLGVNHHRVAIGVDRDGTVGHQRSHDWIFGLQELSSSDDCCSDGFRFRGEPLLVAVLDGGGS